MKKPWFLFAVLTSMLTLGACNPSGNGHRLEKEEELDPTMRNSGENAHHEGREKNQDGVKNNSKGIQKEGP